MKEEKKQAIYKAYVYSEQLASHIKKIENNSNRENELVLSRCLMNLYTKLDGYETEALYCENNIFKGISAVLKSNKMFILFNRITRKLTDFKGEKITYVNSPKKSIKDKISLLAKPNGSADEIITKVDYKLLKEISKELEQ